MRRAGEHPDDFLAHFYPADAILARTAAAVAPNTWVATLTQYMQGALPAETFLSRAAKDNGQRTATHTYVALEALLAGQVEAARMHLTWVKEHGERNYTKYEIALGELERLASGR